MKHFYITQIFRMQSIHLLHPAKQDRKQGFIAACHRMQIHLPVHMVTGHDIVLNAMYPACFYNDSSILYTYCSQNSLQIKFSIAGSGKISIPQKIIHTIRIQLTAYQLIHTFLCMAVLDNTSNILRQPRITGGKYLMNFAILHDDFHGVLFMLIRTDSLKGVGKRTVSDIMKQTCQHHYRLFVVTQYLPQLINFINHAPHNFINPQRVGEP